MIKYKVTSNESSLAGKVFSTEQDAENCIREYNEEDKRNGCYTSGYWIIIDFKANKKQSKKLWRLKK